MSAVAHDCLTLTPWHELQGCSSGLLHVPYLVFLLSMELGCVPLLVGQDLHTPLVLAVPSPLGQPSFDWDLRRVRLEATFLSEGPSNRGNTTRWEPYRLRISSGDARVKDPLRHAFQIHDRSPSSSVHSGSDFPFPAEEEGRCIALHPPFPAEDRPPVPVPPRSSLHPSSAGCGPFASNVCGPQGCQVLHHTNSTDRADVHIVRPTLQQHTNE